MTTEFAPQSPVTGVWQSAYEDVLRETDTSRLFKLVEIAEAAMMTRRDDLARSIGHHAEWRALQEALENLEAVKRDRLRFRNSPE
jgi:hypothetical protein